MSSTAGHGAKAETCDVAGCDAEAERSINYKQFAKCDLKLKDGEHRSVHLCKNHYKEYKKQTKTSREIDQIYRSGACSNCSSWARARACPPGTGACPASPSAGGGTSSSSTAERGPRGRSWCPPSPS